MRIFINGEEQSERVFIKYTDYGEIKYLNLGQPDFLENTDAKHFKEIATRIDDLNTHIENAESQAKQAAEKEYNNPPPETADQRRQETYERVLKEKLGNRTTSIGNMFYRCCTCEVREVRVWDFALDASDLAEPPTNRRLKLHWDFARVDEMNFPEPNKASNWGVQNLATTVNASQWNLPITQQAVKATAYQAFATVGNREVVSSIAVPDETWSHIALVSTGNYALAFNGENQRALIKDSQGLDGDKAFTLDCTLNWQSNGQKQYVFSKTVSTDDDAAYSYQFGIEADGKPFLNFSMHNAAGDLKRRTYTSNQPLATKQDYYICVNCALKDHFYQEKPDDPRSDRYQLWWLDVHIWIFDLTKVAWHGEEPADPTITHEMMKQAKSKRNSQTMNGFFYVSPKNATNGKIRLHAVEAVASIGSRTGAPMTGDRDIEPGWFAGELGHVRIWNEQLDDVTIKRLAIENLYPANTSTPVAEWKLEENRGLQALDSRGGHTITLSDEKMWVTSRLPTRLNLYINGLPSGQRLKATTSVATGGVRPQLAFGAVPKEGADPIYAFQGKLDDIRIWRDLRTQEEIYDNRFVLLGGNEPDLVGYWPIITASGNRLKDASGRGNHATIEPSTDHKFWQTAAAPISNELPQVRNILGGPQTAFVKTYVSSPDAIEYGDTQYDANGRLQATMKRCQLYLDSSGVCHSVTGFQVGDLELIYIGQAQSDPTLIGYIEGAPPLPGENHTRPYYLSAFAYNSY
ncbi:MAG: hypothetical protein KDE47_33500, partial [Caldilineaceae bacterium]|nr:hypothetical protein [Caldilineaceae bacterium]